MVEYSMFEKGNNIARIARAAEWTRLAVLTLGIAIVQAAPGNAASGNAGPVPAAGSTGFSHVKALGGIDEYRLDSNGLTVLLVPDHSAPVVTFEVTYQVGSRNEVTGTTGATHILEKQTVVKKRSDNRKKNYVEKKFERC